MIPFDLIIKYLSGKASPEDAMLIDKWIASSRENQESFKSIQLSWLGAGKEEMRIPNVNKEWQKFDKQVLNKQTGSGKLVTLRRLALAACFTGVCFLAYYLINTNAGNSQMMVAQAKADTLQLTLPDASEVTLYPGGQLSYSNPFVGNKRELKLDGKAFFSVTPDKQKPFRIDAGGCMVEVLGTSFMVNNYGVTLEVKVETGKVKVSNQIGEVFLTAGEMATCIQQAKISKGKESKQATIIGSFDFSDASLNEVIKQLSAHYKITIQSENSTLGNCRLTASFAAESLENILEVIALTLNISYRNEDGKIFLSGSCK